ncbi:hypothetical protein NG895_18615 [Aeoliella sp. ICT_H6.2]|uniref:Uncharacterized protein n=1 Tax=Aeoliella straminimaris TaxID=2954799 RepID=A0A9X2FBG2_9BACT|nr:hypothetical protein [Aeoliella straminimaris]MCO6045917.1 hypothetical protein [Aeoliella straminimaris]
MAWDHGGRYYTRSRKVNGRVMREYVGGGEMGAMAAELDALRREQREQERMLWKAEQEELAMFDEQVAKCCEYGEVIAAAAMTAAGFHFHRGEWRRRRDQKCPS